MKALTLRGKIDMEEYADLIRIRAELGHRLKRLRKENKISVMKMGSLLRVSHQSIQKYEMGCVDIPISRLLQYCFYLKVESDVLLFVLSLNNTSNSGYNDR